MTREEALQAIKEKMDYYESDKRLRGAIETLVPELREGEDERVRNEILIYIGARQDIDLETHNRWCAYLEKQKETSINWMKSDNVKNPDKPYIDKAGMFYTTDGRMCYASEIEKQRDENAKDSFERGIRVGMIRQQKEQKPIKWTDLTWKDIVELEGIINNVHYDFSAGIGQESFGKEVLERFRSTKGIEYLDEAEQKCWREDGQKEQKPDWSEEDKEMLECVIMDVESAKENYLKSTTEVVRQGAIIADKELAWLKALRPSWKPSEEQMDRLFSIVAALRKDYCDDMADFLANLYADLDKLGVKEEPEYYQHFDPDC